MAHSLDGQVSAFRNRPLDARPYTFVWLDALTLKVREAGRTVLVHALLAVGVNADGQREVLGLDVASGEDGAGWLAFLRSLTARGLSGVRLIISDAHRGLVGAIGAALPGAQWQRCRTHYLRNLLAKVPKSAQPWVATLVRTIFDQPDAAAVTAQFDRVLDTIAQKFPAAAEHLPGQLQQHPVEPGPSFVGRAGERHRATSRGVVRERCHVISGVLRSFHTGRPPRHGRYPHC